MQPSGSQYRLVPTLGVIVTQYTLTDPLTTIFDLNLIVMYMLFALVALGIVRVVRRSMAATFTALGMFVGLFGLGVIKAYVMYGTTHALVVLPTVMIVGGLLWFIAAATAFIAGWRHGHLLAMTTSATAMGAFALMSLSAVFYLTITATQYATLLDDLWAVFSWLVVIGIAATVVAGIRAAITWRREVARHSLQFMFDGAAQLSR